MFSKLSGKKWLVCVLAGAGYWKHGGLHMTLILSAPSSHLSQEDSCQGLGGTVDIPVDRGFLVWRFAKFTWRIASACSRARPGRQHLPGRAWPPEMCWFGGSGMAKTLSQFAWSLPACKRVKTTLSKRSSLGTSLVVQWLRFRAPNAGVPGLTPGQGTRSHMHAATKSSHATNKEPTYHN